MRIGVQQARQALVKILVTRKPEEASRSMWRSALKVMAATAAFGLVHSALASRTAKVTAARLVGERNRNGLYRLFYLAQSAGTVGLLTAYIRRLPNREFYRLRAPWAVVMHTGQVVALVYATAAARQVGLRRITGVENLLRWLGEGPVPTEPEAQGPALDGEGRGRHAGPFAWSRHPLNFAPLPVFWLHPRMTTNLLAFNVAATLYLVVGSLHEEARLRHAFGEAYHDYQTSGVPFYLPRPGRSPLEPVSTLETTDRPTQAAVADPLC
jgi:hypothetical protein